LLDLSWRAAPANLDEQAYLTADPFLSALAVAAAKARAVDGQRADEIILAADTLVVVDRDVLGKPPDAGAARTLLRRLSGRPHQVLTGVVLRTASTRQWGAVVSTDVEMRPYTESDIEAYIARGEPFDKAGGYAIQDGQFRPVERVTGCYLNVVGLPVCAAAAGLAALGVRLEMPDRGSSPTPPCELCRAGAELVAR
jgi:MAF protein